MTNTELLFEAIQAKGYKKQYVAQSLGISRNSFYKKAKNLIPFSTKEIMHLCKLLDISSLTQKEHIFFADKVD